LDKYFAKKNKWRIRERTLFVLALLGGSAGLLASMHAFRHKTRHKAFVVGVPVILVIQVASIFYFVIPNLQQN